MLNMPRSQSFQIDNLTNYPLYKCAIIIRVKKMSNTNNIGICIILFSIVGVSTFKYAILIHSINRDTKMTFEIL
jgi:hypothetical protein